MKLSDARNQAIGTNYEILSFIGDALLRERLHELGLRQGTLIEYRGAAPMGGPMVFHFKAASIALRKDEADCLLVKPYKN